MSSAADNVRKSGFATRLHPRADRLQGEARGQAQTRRSSEDHGRIRIRRNQRAGPLDSGIVSAPDVSAAREQLQSRGLLPAGCREGSRRRGQLRQHVQEGQAEVAPDLRAPAGDDDRGRRERRCGARDARGADRRQVPAGGGRRGPRGRRVGHDPLARARTPPEGLQPAVRARWSRRASRRERSTPSSTASRRRSRRRQAQAPREGRDGLPGRRNHRSRRSSSSSC